MDPYSDVPETDAARPKPRHWSTQVHKTSQYKALRAQFKQYCATQRNADGSFGLPCGRCGDAINYRLTYPHPGSFALDHILSVADHPELALSPSNFRPCHKRCNEERGSRRDDDEDDLDLGELSEDW